MGVFPRSVEGLRALPGIGPYTANAIGAIAFALPVLPVDGNIERVAARIFGIVSTASRSKAGDCECRRGFHERCGGVRGTWRFRAGFVRFGRYDLHAAQPGLRHLPWLGHCKAQAAGMPPSCRRAPQSPRGRAGPGRCMC